MKLTIYAANCAGNEKNCLYPNKVDITTKEDMQKAVAYDHVCASYQNNYRSNENFISSDVVVMDCDNDHSENPDDWLTPEKFAKLEPNIDFIATPSRHNNISKNGKAPRPKWHIYFPIAKTTDHEFYATIKKKLQAKYPLFDDNALDSARFIYGAAPDYVYWQEGWLDLAYVLDDIEPNKNTANDTNTSSVISQGSRNKSMSLFAAKILKRFGDSDKTQSVYLEHAQKCDPPLEETELTTIWQSALRFYQKKVVNAEGYVSPEEYNDEFNGAPYTPEDFSDIGEAKMLAKVYGDELKFNNATDYLRFNGSCWIEDRQMAVGATEEFLDLQLADAQNAVTISSYALINAGIAPDIIKAGGKILEKACNTDSLQELLNNYLNAKAYEKFIMKCRNYKNFINIQNAAKPLLAIDINLLDHNPLLLNTPQATYDMSQGVAGHKAHDPRDYITKITNTTPGDEGQNIWQEALQTFFCNDSELINYVQMIVGLAAIGKVYQEHLIIAFGGGANGKSTFWNTIYRVLGSYAGKISTDALTMNCKRNVKPEMAEVKGKRLIIASELDEGMRLSTGTIKQLCSTDAIQAEKKYKDPFAFEPSHTLVLYTNHLPRVNANDDGTWRRLIVIPFNAKITGSSDIKNYSDYLFEHAGPSIIKWIICSSSRFLILQ